MDKYHGREKEKEIVWIIHANSIYTAIMLTRYEEDILSVSRKIADIRGIVRNISVIRNRKEETTWRNRDFVPLHGWCESLGFAIRRLLSLEIFTICPQISAACLTARKRETCLLNILMIYEHHHTLSDIYMKAYFLYLFLSLFFSISLALSRLRSKREKKEA